MVFCCLQNNQDVIGGRVGGARGTSPPPPQKKKKLGGRREVLVPKNTFTDVFHNTCDISAYFLPSDNSRTTGLPKKHNEAGPPEQLPTDALSQIDNGHTRHCEDCLCQQIMQRVF